MCEECCGEARMYLFQELYSRVQHRDRRGIRVDDQVERFPRSPLVRVVNQAVAEGDVEIKATVDGSPVMIANPSLERYRRVLGGIPSALAPVFDRSNTQRH